MVTQCSVVFPKQLWSSPQKVLVIQLLFQLFKRYRPTSNSWSATHKIITVDELLLLLLISLMYGLTLTAPEHIISLHSRSDIVYTANLRPPFHSVSLLLRFILFSTGYSHGFTAAVWNFWNRIKTYVTKRSWWTRQTDRRRQQQHQKLLWQCKC